MLYSKYFNFYCIDYFQKDFGKYYIYTISFTLEYNHSIVSNYLKYKPKFYRLTTYFINLFKIKDLNNFDLVLYINNYKNLNDKKTNLLLYTFNDMRLMRQIWMSMIARVIKNNKYFGF